MSWTGRPSGVVLDAAFLLALSEGDVDAEGHMAPGVHVNTLRDSIIENERSDDNTGGHVHVNTSLVHRRTIQRTSHFPSMLYGQLRREISCEVPPNDFGIISAVSIRVAGSPHSFL